MPMQQVKSPEEERIIGSKEETGVELMGVTAINPASGEQHSNIYK